MSGPRSPIAAALAVSSDDQLVSCYLFVSGRLSYEAVGHRHMRSWAKLATSLSSDFVSSFGLTIIKFNISAVHPLRFWMAIECNLSLYITSHLRHWRC